MVWDRSNGVSGPDGVFVGSLGAGEVISDIDTAVMGTGSIGDLVWVDVNEDGVRGPGDVGAPGVRVVVTWLGGDGVLGGGDDLVVEVRTDADGVYLVEGLPAGEYVVAFDRSTFPKGTVAYSDLDGGDLLVASVTLGAGQDRTDVDLVLRSSVLALTGATIGGVVAVALILLGTGVYLRRRVWVLGTRTA